MAETIKIIRSNERQIIRRRRMNVCEGIAVEEGIREGEAIETCSENETPT